MKSLTRTELEECLAELFRQIPAVIAGAHVSVASEAIESLGSAVLLVTAAEDRHYVLARLNDALARYGYELRTNHSPNAEQPRVLH